MKNRVAAFLCKKWRCGVYTYTDPLGRRKYVYAQDLVTLLLVHPQGSFRVGQILHSHTYQ